MPLLPNRGPAVANTHTPIPPAELFALRNALVAKAAKGRLTFAQLQEVATESGKPLEHVYAAVSVDPNLAVECNQELLFGVCTGGCQSQGALANLAKLLELRQARLASGKPSFDIVPRSCLDMCPHAPVMISRGAHGQAAHPRVRIEQVQEIVSALLDG